MTRRRIRSIAAALLCATALQLAAPADAADEYRTVTVADPYIEMHSGPGRGYPVFHVVDRGESVEIIKQRADWFLVRAGRGKEGWVKQEQMNRTLQPDGNTFSVPRPSIEDFTNAKWELGVLAGDFDGANIVSLYGSYSLNPHVSVELWGSQILGNFSDGWMASANIVHETWPEWRVSPFFTMGAGIIRTEPKTTIIQPEDRTDEIGHVGAGFRIYITRRFLFRAEFKSYVVFTSRDENEEVEEWKAGFAYFF
ncbi:MAG: SH3 domain-containing protein [Gammaproteobacteria bacterium]|nr:SH3 domain-containing protein [Gammaproteobacteria bacterium]MBT8104465.1 SH3 domain-containing protein [Gammaproteobacteria bacterium]NNK24480.1 SH3 domain-containing protein [Woeseiaceae bacterium]